MGSHRYWRLRNNNGDWSYYAFREVEFRANWGSADQTGSGTATASSGTPANGVDNNTGTSWQSQYAAGVGAKWFAYDFGSAVYVGELAIYVSTADPFYSPTTFLLDYSDDGTNWTLADTYTGIAWVANAWNRFFASNSDPNGTQVAIVSKVVAHALMGPVASANALPQIFVVT